MSNIDVTARRIYKTFHGVKMFVVLRCPKQLVALVVREARRLAEFRKGEYRI